MTIDETEHIEQENKDKIHLYKVGAFYEVYEKSCFYFYKFLFPYKVRFRFVKKLSKTILNLGFYEKNLPKVKEKAISLGFKWVEENERHIEILGVSCNEDYEKWKEDIVNEKIVDSITKRKTNEDNILIASAIAYDLCLYLFKRSAGFAKDFKYSLGLNLQQGSFELLNILHFKNLDSKAESDFYQIKEVIEKVKLQVRFLHDLKQFSHKQYFFIIQKLETILNACVVKH